MHDLLIPASDDTGETLTRERCHVRELLNHADVPDVSLARCRVEPGVTTERHRLGVDEWYVIERGRGRMRLGDAPPFEVAAGDGVAIPAGTAQCIENAGEVDLVFLCICRPRFTQATYEALEPPR